MNGRNEEQYPDFTAEAAMLRVMAGDPERTDVLDDEGCRLLIRAVVRQAVEDRFRALRHTGRVAERLREETEAFFRSAYFRRLTGMNGAEILRLIRKEADRE